ncbi:MAG: Crp/Fnr family transcriptional regulator [Pseudomonadota bacterium]|jgi:serine/threonine-protein kinase
MQQYFFKQREKFRREIVRRYGVSDDEYTEMTLAIAPIAHPFTAAKGEYLQRQGGVAQSIYWITEGVTRNGFIVVSGADVTIRFATEGWNANAHEDLLSISDGVPAMQFIMAETAVRGFRWDWADICRLRDESQFFSNYYLKVLEHMIKLSARRTYAFAASTALERLEAFRSDYPGLECRISQRILASYLGVTQPYLSRILAAHPAGGEGS